MAENKWICPACGQENDGKFCVGCGAAAPVAAAAEAVENKAEEVAAEATAAVEEAAAPVAAVAAEAAEAAEAAPEAAETIAVPAEPAYDTTPVEQITEPVAAPVAEESVTPAYAPVEPAKVDPDEFVPAEPDHSPKAAPAPDYSDPDNFVPAPMQPQKQQNAYSGAAAAAEPKPAGYNQALIGLILAIAGAVFLWVPFLGIGLAVAGLVLAIVAKSKGFNGGMRTAAFIISIISIGLSIAGTIGCIACIACSYY